MTEVVDTSYESVYPNEDEDSVGDGIGGFAEEIGFVAGGFFATAGVGIVGPIPFFSLF